MNLTETEFIAAVVNAYEISKDMEKCVLTEAFLRNRIEQFENNPLILEFLKKQFFEMRSEILKEIREKFKFKINEEELKQITKEMRDRGII